MGLTFNNPNNLQKMFDKFASVPDPKKAPKMPRNGELDKPKKGEARTPNVINSEKEPEIKNKKKKDKK